MRKLEIACFNYESCINAQSGGANRIEICADRNSGGLTPHFDLVKKVRKEIAIDLYVMIRPRGGNFAYSDSEFEQMKYAIDFMKKTEVNGIVFGILNSDSTIDVERNKFLVKYAFPLFSTFHRAFDEVHDPHLALQQIIDCGFDTLLTSGQKPDALIGSECIRELILLADNRIVIMPGGGIRSENILAIMKATGAKFFHSSAIIDEGGIANLNEVTAMKKTIADNL